METFTTRGRSSDGQPERLLLQADIARLLRVTPPRVHQLRQRPDFPQPIGRVGQHGYPVWNQIDVARWARVQGRL